MRPNLRACPLAAAGVMLAAFCVASYGQAENESELLRVGLGQGVVVTLPRDIDRIALVDEAVARVTILDKQELLVHGLKAGDTSLFAWFSDGSRKQYNLRVGHDLEILNLALKDLNPAIVAKESSDGRCIMITGEVSDARVAEEAGRRLDRVLGSIGKDRPVILNLLRYPEETGMASADVRLAEALKSIDPRIRVRRVQVSDQTDSKADSYVLEGRVRTVDDLVRAVILAERQLGGSGGLVESPDVNRVRSGRKGGVLSATGSTRGQLQALENAERPKAGLAAQVSRGLVISSDSGRVLSFLKVDEIHQILVANRVFEIDRSKARDLGINYRVDGERFSVGSYTGPQDNLFESLRGQPASVSGIVDGNLVGAYVSGSVAVLSAVDFLERKAVARSVAEPNVMTLSGEEATVLIGGEVPIPTTTVGEVAAVQGYNFQSFGVRLDIRPTVGEDNFITLEVAPSIVRPDSGLSVEGVPGFKVQSVQTTARVRAGESLVLGGLLSFQEVREERKLPILGDLPVIKTFFKWSSNSREEKELLFVITPRIMNQEEPVDLSELVVLPGLDSRDFRIGDKVEPQVLTEQGIPSSWPPEPEPSEAEETAPAAEGDVPGPLNNQPEKSSAVDAEKSAETTVSPQATGVSGEEPELAETEKLQGVDQGANVQPEAPRKGLISRFLGIFRSEPDEGSAPEEGAPEGVPDAP